MARLKISLILGEVHKAKQFVEVGVWTGFNDALTPSAVTWDLTMEEWNALSKEGAEVQILDGTIDVEKDDVRVPVLATGVLKWHNS